jgi:hypothetical protein
MRRAMRDDFGAPAFGLRHLDIAVIGYQKIPLRGDQHETVTAAETLDVPLVRRIGYK